MLTSYTSSEEENISYLRKTSGTMTKVLGCFKMPLTNMCVSRPRQFLVSLNLSSGGWIIVTSHCATHVVDEDLSKPQPIESSQFQNEWKK